MPPDPISRQAPAPIEGRRLKRALKSLAAADEDLARALAAVGPPPPRHRPAGFASLLDIILAQQVSTASARAIATRLGAALEGVIEPERLLGLDDAALAAIGFSRSKMRLAALAELDDEAAVAALVGLDGIGRWSAEIYLLSSLHRADVMPADDLALLIGYQRLTGAAARPGASALRLRAEAWRPWRSVAARLLWHYYARGPKP